MQQDMNYMIANMKQDQFKFEHKLANVEYLIIDLKVIFVNLYRCQIKNQTFVWI